MGKQDDFGILAYCSATNLPGTAKEFLIQLRGHMNLDRKTGSSHNPHDFTIVLMDDVDIKGPDDEIRVGKARRCVLVIIIS